MADYWMKLYIEILDDPKMATLPDRVWRRIIELFLAAKREQKDGYLPDTRQLAWMLRMNPDELEGDLAQVAQTGIIQRVVNGWLIPKFAERQSAVPAKERMAQMRERDQRQEYYGNVTDELRNVTQSRVRAETETEAESAAFILVRDAITKNTGVPPAGPNDIKAIDEIVKMGASEVDIIAGIDWLRGQGKPIKYLTSVVGPTRTAMSKRIQGNGNGRKTEYTGPDGEIKYL
jgi:hypothetical protein